ncbi:MAG TPA: MBL fold metallo-hydrolase [Polyangiaceae bacterium]|nr:MBL fold metallo-hydrolase [Polyangiaceae bacterium]
MKITVFQSDKGDCLLVESQDERMLVDGGMGVSYSDHVAPFMGRLREAGKVLDVVYVSHIDDDHIGGVLRMMDDAMAWRVHEFQKANDNPHHKQPDAPQPPEINAIWHNAFHELVEDNEGEIESLLAASATILSASLDEALVGQGLRMADLQTSKRQAIQLSKRISDGQLGIPLNPQFEGKLMMVRDRKPIFRLGAADVSVIGPFSEELDTLRGEWNEWLKENKKTIRELNEKAIADQKKIGTSELERLVLPMAKQAQIFGNIKKVTAPNLASLMLFVKEGQKTLLLTGDGHANHVVAGLEHIRALDGQGKIHVDVLKVPHHGSEHNMTKEFARDVTADHYVFCGNGFSTNPEISVVELLFKERMKKAGEFKFSFNSRSTVIQKEDNQKHMKALETKVKDLQQNSSGRLATFFSEQSSFEIDL